MKKELKTLAKIFGRKFKEAAKNIRINLIYILRKQYISLEILFTLFIRFTKNYFDTDSF